MCTEESDMRKIFTYPKNGEVFPTILPHRVWFLTPVHLLSRGLQFHQQLTPKTFEFPSNEDGEYVILTHGTQKSFQDGISCKEAPADKRMYADGSECCHVKMSKLLI
jgi:hypothetical protein